MVKFILNKLVRDRAPEIFGRKGHVLNTRPLEPQEREGALCKKLLEEAQEVIAAKTPQERVEELADLLEVMQALRKTWGLSWDHVEEVRAQKAATHGDFSGGLYAAFCEIPESDQAFLAHFRGQPEKYPEQTS